MGEETSEQAGGKMKLDNEHLPEIIDSDDGEIYPFFPEISCSNAYGEVDAIYYWD